MTGKRKNRKPLLYIQQPNFQLSAGNMQEFFSSRAAAKKAPIMEESPTELKNDDVSKNEKKEGRKKEKNRSGQFQQFEEFQVVESQTKIYDEDSVEDDKFYKPNYTMRRVKSFKEMNVHERLIYLEGFPKQLPSVPCMFSTDNETYKGFLHKLSEDCVEVSLFDKSVVSLNIKDLKEVKMIGHRK